MTRLGLCAVFLAAAAAAIAQPADEELALDAALTAALRNNYQLRMAALEVQKAEDRTAAARTRRMPSVNVSLISAQLLTKLSFQFPAGSFGTFPATGPIPAVSSEITTNRRPITIANATVMQPLTQLQRVNLSIQMGKLGEELARMRVQAQRQTVINEVKKLYYGLVQTQTGLDTLEDSLKFIRELDRTVTQYVAERVALRSESLEVKTRVLGLESQVLTLRHALETQKEQLNLLLGRDVRSEFRVATVPEPAAYEADLKAAQTAAVQNRPDLREARLRERQAEYDRRVKRAEYIPDVSFMFGYLSPFGITMLPRNIAVAGVNVSWEPFDWGRKKHELAEKDRTLQQAALAIKQSESAILVEVAASFRKLEETRMQVKVALLSQDVAKEQFRVSKTKYEEKAALLQDVLQRQAAVSDANGKYQQALLAFWTAKADLERAIGQDN